MPRVLDNIDQKFLRALEDNLQQAQRADICVGYFSLAGWRMVDHVVEQWPEGEGRACYLIVGMQELPSNIKQPTPQDLQIVTQQFCQQLLAAAPKSDEKVELRRLSKQIIAGKLRIKLYLRHRQHAKLYLFYNSDPVGPANGFVGSSNLTYGGLSGQGELNIALDPAACQELSAWFAELWHDDQCWEVSEGAAELIGKMADGSLVLYTEWKARPTVQMAQQGLLEEAAANNQPSWLATEKQVAAVYNIARSLGLEADEVDAYSQQQFMAQPKELSKGDASHLIEVLKQPDDKLRDYITARQQRPRLVPQPATKPKQGCSLFAAGFVALLIVLAETIRRLAL